MGNTPRQATREELVGRMTAALSLASRPGSRIMQICQRIGDQLELVPLIELVELLEDPHVQEARVRGNLLAERFPTTTRHGQTTTPEGETR
jgi:hypothetical protein